VKEKHEIISPSINNEGVSSIFFVLKNY